MNEKVQIQKISTSRKFILLEDNMKIDLPEWLKKRYNSMQYLNKERLLQINCYKCKKWLNIVQLNENNEWIDIHNNFDIKLTNSGFSSYCQICNNLMNIGSIKEVLSNTVDEIPIPISKMEKDTIFLTPENMKYVKLRLALSDLRKADFYNYLIEQEKRLNPMSKFL